MIKIVAERKDKVGGSSGPLRPDPRRHVVRQVLGQRDVQVAPVTNGEEATQGTTRSSPAWRGREIKRDWDPGRRSSSGNSSGMREGERVGSISVSTLLVQHGGSPRRSGASRTSRSGSSGPPAANRGRLVGVVEHRQSKFDSGSLPRGAVGCIDVRQHDADEAEGGSGRGVAVPARDGEPCLRFSKLNAGAKDVRRRGVCPLADASAVDAARNGGNGDRRVAGSVSEREGSRDCALEESLCDLERNAPLTQVGADNVNDMERNETGREGPRRELRTSGAAADAPALENRQGLAGLKEPAPCGCMDDSVDATAAPAKGRKGTIGKLR